MSKVIMSGNEAVARGAYEAGCAVAAAYPGTPSTEILENISGYKEISSGWSSNEKVALETAAGASIGGARALAAMKHVGLNVAADPLFTLGYTGVNGGLVVITADDPGCHSSQNEQDNRFFAPAAKLAMIEPSDSQECLDYIKEAFEVSEKFDVPVLFRMTTRVCHSKSLVETGERLAKSVKKYVSEPKKYAMLPTAARVRHIEREKSLEEMKKYSDTTLLNRAEWGSRDTGIITSGISYQYAREVFGENASYLKLGFTHPLPELLIESFAREVGKLYVIEEGEPYIENKVRSMGFGCIGKERIPVCGELNTRIIREAFFGKSGDKTYETGISAPPRPPVLCAGCPHRGFFYSLKKHKKDIVGVGDIGCYALGVSPPFEAFDIVICMGSGISSAIGLSEALRMQGDRRKVFGMVGDSTFFHSGITGLIDAAHCGSDVCICILDNSTTAMTGHQENPGTKTALSGEIAKQINIHDVVRAAGIEEGSIRIVNPQNIRETDEAVESAINKKGPFVIITKSPCVLLKDVAVKNAGRHCAIDAKNCTGCRSCMKLACPALSVRGEKADIDASSCSGCGLCAQLCKFGAIKNAGETK